MATDRSLVITIRLVLDGAPFTEDEATEELDNLTTALAEECQWTNLKSYSVERSDRPEAIQ